MLRIRVPNGIATSAQLRTLADLAFDFGREQVDITTRQQVQIRWFRIEHVPEIFARLEAVGLTSKQTGMDNIRNVIGCPLAGLTTHELFDASPVAQAFTGREGKYVTVKETIRGFQEILDGKHDNIREDMFYMAGGIDEVVQRYDDEQKKG